METIEYRFIDKSAWGVGAWQVEPDKVQWPDPVTGLPCLAVRNPETGAWCGYAGVTEPHPYFGRPYEEIDESVTAHGGLTFAGLCMDDDKEHRICHRPDAGEPDRVWWFGFDCAHCDDLKPAMEATFQLMRQTFPEAGPKLHRFGVNYRSLPYVKTVCMLLAGQLFAAGKK